MDLRTDGNSSVSMLEQSDWLSLAASATAAVRRVLGWTKASGCAKASGETPEASRESPEHTSATSAGWRDIRLFRM